MDERVTYHAMETGEVLERLGTSFEGLTADEARARLEKFGRNVLEEEEIDRLGLFIGQFRNFLVYILVAAAIISLFAADIKDFAVIVGIILVNGFIGYWQEIRAETSIRALKKLTESKVTVVREGQRTGIPSSELVPGDVVLLAEGDLVTADIRLVESAGLMVDEATLTGESVPVSKDCRILLGPSAQPYEMTNSVLAGTTVVRGSGSGFVAFTGHQTYLATIAERAQESSRESPFTRAIRHFSVRYAVLLIVLLAVVGGVAFMQGREAVGIAYLLVAHLVSAVPEGLPLVVTLVMVVGALALSRKQTLTRHLPSVETLGSATVIASDKTGTITEGRLVVHDVYALDPDDLALAAALCNDAREGTGDPIDVALSRWVDGYDERRRKHPRTWVFPFDTAMKLLAA